MKLKSEAKKVRRVNFWGKYEKIIPIELKEMVFDQYYSRDTLYIYCDSSCSKVNSDMAVACTYVKNGSIYVKKKFIRSPKDCVGKNIYGELKAVFFALKNFVKYLGRRYDSVIIFSDVNDIKRILLNKIVFKNNDSLRKLQVELITLYKEKKIESPGINIEIKYLPLNLRKHNPFMKASHNASRKLMKRKYSRKLLEDKNDKRYY